MEPMAVVPYFLFHHSNPLLDHRQDVTANSDAWWYHANIMNQHPMQFHAQPEAQSHRGLIAIDPFRVDPMALSAAGLLALPPNFPLHADSIRAEIFSQKNQSHHADPMTMLDFFARKLFLHTGEIWSKRQQYSLMREPPTFLILFLLNSAFLLPASQARWPRSHTWLETTAFVNVGETNSRQDSKKYGNMGTAQKINRSLPWLHGAKSSALKTYLLRPLP
jgi:hypothetical protein